MQALWQNPILRVGLMLALFAISATALVALTEENTREQIAANEREALLEAINILVPKNKFDNQILQDRMNLPATDMDTVAAFGCWWVFIMTVHWPVFG